MVRKDAWNDFDFFEFIKRPPQTQQYNQDEETEEYTAGKGTGEKPPNQTKQKRKR